MEDLGKKYPWDAFVNGAVSGSISSTLLQPLDMLKTRQQTVFPRKNIFNLVGSILRQEGALALWKGLVPTLARTVPGVAIHFSALQTLQQGLLGDTKPTRLQSLALGCTSRCAAGVLLIPMTVIKTRYESGLFAYRSGLAGLLSALKSVFRVEGVIGLTSGIVPTLLRDVPFSGLYLMFYTEFKSIAKATNNQKSEERNPPKLMYKTRNEITNFVCGMCAGLVACAITHPFDVFKTKIQTSRSVQPLAAVIKNVIKSEGLRGMLVGLPARMVRRSVMAALTWTLFEHLTITATKRTTNS